MAKNITPGIGPNAPETDLGVRTESPVTRQVTSGEKVTVNLTTRATRSLVKVMAAKEESKTEVINRAVQLYELLESIWAEGGNVILEPKGDKPIHLKMF